MNFNYGAARKFLQRKEEKRKKELDSLFEQAWKDFKAIIEMIIKKYEPQKIYQWGSLLERNHFSKISDIDIAVVGDFSPQEFFSMFGEADEMTDFPLDLVELDKIEPIYAESIRQNGKLVYEK